MDALINPFVKKILGAVIRAVLMLAVPYLVSQGIWTPDEATATVATVATALTALTLSLLEKYWTRQKLVTALAMPTGSTERDVEAQIKSGPTPPVTLAKDEPPIAVP